MPTGTFVQRLGISDDSVLFYAQVVNVVTSRTNMYTFKPVLLVYMLLFFDPLALVPEQASSHAPAIVWTLHARDFVRLRTIFFLCNCV